MFFVATKTSLQLFNNKGGVLGLLSLSQFAFISGIAASHDEKFVVITAILEGARLPSFEPNYRGDIRLFKGELASGKWEQIGDFYANDAQIFPDDLTIAYHTGNGIAVCDIAERRQKAFFKLGQFNWGAPAISISPTGEFVAGTKWKGDDGHLAILNVLSGEGVVCKPSFYKYGWLSAEQLIYETRAGLRVLDVLSGKSTDFITNVPRFFSKQAHAEFSPDFERFLQQETKSLLSPWSVDHPVVAFNELYFAIRYSGSSPQHNFIFSYDLATKKATQLFHSEQGIVRSLEAIAKGTISVCIEHYKDATLQRREIKRVGNFPELPEDAQFIPEHNVPRGTFHYWGQFEKKA